MKRSGILIALASAISASPLWAAPLTFNGVSGKSTLAAVQAKFPTAETGRSAGCKGETSRYANGVRRCEYLKVPSYKLAGYDFEVFFSFYESGSLATASLTWPRVAEGAETPTKQEIENAYWSIVELLVSKYGRYVSEPPCSLIGNNCQEWQLDGSTTWHAGGERIEIEYETDTRFLSGVTLKYRFADAASFDRF